jgi:lipopolysaccharide/colanic/teichoic acid biosynthesis glycosyltransferase
LVLILLSLPDHADRRSGHPSIDSPGPILYRQERVGLHGRIFHVVKFRSMRTDAEKDGVPRWACRPATDRVTRVGRVIRKPAH